MTHKYIPEERVRELLTEVDHYEKCYTIHEPCMSIVALGGKLHYLLATAVECPECAALEARVKELEEDLEIEKAVTKSLQSALAASKREAEARYDCHDGPGTTFSACGICNTCLTRDLAASRGKLQEAEKALEDAYSRFGLIKTARERGFEYAYIDGCAMAARETIDAALAAIRKE
jgi:hypothetical protein